MAKHDSEGVDEIYVNALSRENPAERKEYLDRVCAGDAKIRDRLERLLSVHTRLGTFLENAAPELALTLPQESEIPGSQIGPYTLLELIGDGGMGAVWLAERREPVQRQVALKLIKPGMDSRQVLARFDAERQALSLMDHPNIASVLDAGNTKNGHPYFVMELVKGQPITKYCDQQRMPIRERLQLFVSVCNGIQHAHQKGIIHRDIKPSNILVTEFDGRPVAKIIDFGIAKAVNQPLLERSVLTEYGQIIGTLEYMSPEQARMAQQDVDTRSDVYSLGVLLYELLTGSTPFEQHRLRKAAFDELLRIIRQEEPVRPSIKLRNCECLTKVATSRMTEPARLTNIVRGELDWIVLKAIEKDRERRYETASSMAMDVQRYLADEDVLACPPSTVYRIRKFAKRNQASLMTAALLIIVSLVTTVLVSREAIRATRAGHLANDRLTAELHARRMAELSTIEAKKQLFDACLNQAKATRLSEQSGHRFAALAAITKASELQRELQLEDHVKVALRNETIGGLELLDLRLLEKHPVRRSQQEGALWLSHDFQFLAKSAGDEIQLYKLAPKLRQIKSIPTRKEELEQHLCFDPTNRYLLSWRPILRVLRVIEIATGREVYSRSGIQEYSAADFHPYLQRLTLGETNGKVRTVDLATSEEILSWELGEPIWSVKYSPNGELVAIATNKVHVCEAASGRTLSSTPTVGSQPILAWDSAGKRLAVAVTPDISLFSIDHMDRRPLVLQGHRSRVTFLQFHPEGTYLCSSSWDGTSRLWDSVSGQQLLRFEGSIIGFNPDGTRMAIQDSLDLAMAEVVLPTSHHWLYRGMTYSVTAAEEVRLMASCHDDGVRLWDLDRRIELAHLPTGFTHGAAFCPSSQALFVACHEGLYEFPYQVTEETDRRKIHFAPPQAIDSQLKNRRSVCVSDDGQWVFSDAFYRHDIALFGKSQTGWQPHELQDSTMPKSFGSTNASQVALSPNGKWAAAATHGQVRVWRTETGQHIIDLSTNIGELSNSISGPICFSSDNRTLVTNSSSEMRIWDVPSGRLRHTVNFAGKTPWALAISPDGQIVAVSLWGIGIELVEVNSGRRVAVLELPERPPVSVEMKFTADGSQFIVAADHSGCCVWDIYTLRRQLAAVSLDWSHAPLPNRRADSAVLPMYVEYPHTYANVFSLSGEANSN